MMLSKFRLQALAVMALTGCGVFQFGEFAPPDRPASDAGVSDGSHDQHTSGDLSSHRPCQEDEQGGAYKVLACWEITSANHPECTTADTNWKTLGQDWGFNGQLMAGVSSKCTIHINVDNIPHNKDLLLKIKHKIEIPRFSSSPSLNNMYAFNLIMALDRMLPDMGNKVTMQIGIWQYNNIPYYVDKIPFQISLTEKLTDILFQVDASYLTPTAPATWDMQRISIVECVSPGNCP